MNLIDENENYFFRIDNNSISNRYIKDYPKLPDFSVFDDIEDKLSYKHSEFNEFDKNDDNNYLDYNYMNNNNNEFTRSLSFDSISIDDFSISDDNEFNEISHVNNVIKPLSFDFIDNNHISENILLPNESGNSDQLPNDDYLSKISPVLDYSFNEICQEISPFPITLKNEVDDKNIVENINDDKIENKDTVISIKKLIDSPNSIMKLYNNNNDYSPCKKCCIKRKCRDDDEEFTLSKKPKRSVKPNARKSTKRNGSGKKVSPNDLNSYSSMVKYVVKCCECDKKCQKIRTFNVNGKAVCINCAIKGDYIINDLRDWEYPQGKISKRCERSNSYKDSYRFVRITKRSGPKYVTICNYCSLIKEWEHECKKNEINQSQ